MDFGYIGKNVIVALREPSLGPVFGLKGGATGGGKSTSAVNLIAACIDNHIYFGNSLRDRYREDIFQKSYRYE